MNNFPPVGDIKIAKSKGTYNTYKLELSYGQMECIVQALQAKHDDSIADELLAMFNYYMHELPGPGEEEDDLEARKAAVTGTEQADAGGDDFPVPMPPGSETAVPDKGEGDGLPDLPTGDEMGGEAGGSKPDPFGDIGLEDEQDAEALLPEPPKE